MKEVFIVPLLHPHVTSPIAAPLPEFDESLEHLPITSRFLSPIGFRYKPPTAVNHASRREDRDPPHSGSLNSDYQDDNDRLGKVYNEARRGGQGNNLAPKHNHPRSPYRTGKNTSVPFPSRSLGPHQIPDDLRQCLEVIEYSILAGHVKLREGLRKRYDEQFPLVRSLEGVFVANVRLFIHPSYWPDHPLTLALVLHPPRICRLCPTFGTGPRASQ